MKKTKKLELRRETVRHIRYDDLALIGGGSDPAVQLIGDSTRTNCDDAAAPVAEPATTCING